MAPFTQQAVEPEFEHEVKYDKTKPGQPYFGDERIPKPQHWPADLTVDGRQRCKWLPLEWGQALKCVESGKPLQVFVSPGGREVSRSTEARAKRKIEDMLDRTLHDRPEGEAPLDGVGRKFILVKGEAGAGRDEKAPKGWPKDTFVDVGPRATWLPKGWFQGFRHGKNDMDRVQIYLDTDLKAYESRAEVEKKWGKALHDKELGIQRSDGLGRKLHYWKLPAIRSPLPQLVETLHLREPNLKKQEKKESKDKEKDKEKKKSKDDKEKKRSRDEGRSRDDGSEAHKAKPDSPQRRIVSVGTSVRPQTPGHADPAAKKRKLAADDQFSSSKMGPPKAPSASSKPGERGASATPAAPAKAETMPPPPRPGPFARARSDAIALGAPERCASGCVLYCEDPPRPPLWHPPTKWVVEPDAKAVRRLQSVPFERLKEDGMVDATVQTSDGTVGVTLRRIVHLERASYELLVKTRREDLAVACARSHLRGVLAHLGLDARS